MSGFAPTLMSGIVIGLMVAVPIGPMGLLCIQRTLASGLMAGLATGLGAATVHLTFGAIAALGLDTVIESSVSAGTQWLSALSAGLLFWFSARVLRRTVTVETGVLREGEWFGLFASSLLYGLTNPITILLFAAALPTIDLMGQRPQVLPLVSGVFIGSAIWWIVLSSGVAVVRHRVSNGLLNLTNKAAGLILATLGTLMLANTIQQMSR